jgi:hypothetical protein
MESVIRLFQAVPVKTKRKKKPSAGLLSKTLQSGFMFSPQVCANYSDQELLKLVPIVSGNVGLSARQMNNSLHKSWKKIKTADIRQLLMEQIIHYITTYGFEAMGVYNEDSVYIPNEKLDIPALTNDVVITVINGYTVKEIKEKVMKLLQSGVALKTETIKDVVSIALEFDDFIKEDEIETVKNKEVKTHLCDMFNLVPKNAMEFLRFIIYKATGTTLLIKSPGLIAQLKESDKDNIGSLFIQYEKKYGLQSLARIFYRFKPIFLAFRTNRALKKYVNKVRRLAKLYHKPMPVDFLNNVTGMIKIGEKISIAKLDRELNKVNTFRKIRLAYALNFRTKDVHSIMYRIRNGKGFATEFEDIRNKTHFRLVRDIVVRSIVKDLKKNVKGKKIFIPENLNYALPATEKQFTGSFPSGTYVTVPKDMVFGVYWENQEKHRIDLDLSVVASGIGKIGWDSHYRDEERHVLFSGDVTDAPKSKGGASELFYVARQKKANLMLFCNYFNFIEDIPVPFKILVAQENAGKMKLNYMVNPNNVKAITTSIMDIKEKMLGIIVTTTKECRFYFAEASISQSITSSDSEAAQHSRNYIHDFYSNTINLNELLVKAGGKLVKDKEKCDIDLSPESLEKDSILNLVM